MIGIAIIGFALATLSYYNALNKGTIVKVSNTEESGEIEDDEI